MVQAEIKKGDIMLEKLFPTWAKKREQERVEFYKFQMAVRVAKRIAESLPDWVDEPDEEEWTVLDSSHTGYDEQDLKKLRAQARRFYYTGGGRGILDALRLLIIGRNASIDSEDEKSQEYWDLWAEANNWDKRSKELILRVFRDGEVFLRFYPPSLSKSLDTENPTQYTMGTVRFIDPDEIIDESATHSYGIQCNPDDVEDPICYYRTFWVGTQKKVEIIPANQIVHMKILCDSNEKRGVSYLVGIAKWIKKYDNWLEDRSYLNRLRTMFNLIAKPEGVTPAAFKENFEDEDYTPSGKTPSKKLPKRGSVIVAQGIDWEFKKPDVQAADTATDGRHLERMICKITHLMEGIITGDFSNQNYASSLVAESPMVRMIEYWQDEFDGCFQKIFKKVIQQGKRLPGRLNQAASEKSSANFAAVVHRELDKDTNAYQVHKQNAWASDRTIATKLGYDYDAEQEQIDKEDERERERAEKREFPGEYPVVQAPGKSQSPGIHTPTP